MKLQRIPDFGVEIIEGLPGSGKSLMAVRRMIEACIAQRRPVFTNLPLKWRVVRRYLRGRGGEQLARLVFDLNEQHFRRFLDRFAAKSAYGQKYKNARGWLVKKQGPTGPILFTDDDVQRDFCEEFGPDLWDGPEANWIPHAALVILDEVHLWFPMSKQKDETPNLLHYLSMHRHMLHWVWAVSQTAGQVSISFRKMCTLYWRVRNMKEDKLVWGLRFGHLRIHGIGYTAFTGDQVEGRSRDNNKPVQNFVIFPRLPWQRHWFRLYNGFAHAGNLRQLLGRLERARERVGVSDRQMRRAAALAAPVTPVPRLTRGKVRRFVGWVRRGTRVVSWLTRYGLAAVVGALVSRVPAPRIGLQPAGSLAATVAVVQPVQTVQKEVKVEQPIEWGTWQGFGPGYVRISGQRVAVGETRGGAVLQAFDHRKRIALWVRDDAVWVWEYRQAEPRRLGRVGEVKLADDHRRATEAAAARSGVPHPDPAPAGFVGPSGRDPVGG